MTTTHLLTLDGMERSDIEDLLDLADEFVEVLARDIPKVPALRGKIVATLFFEPSTRTRLSFEAAAKALSADTMSFAPGTSAVTKGESLKDTVQTLEAMGADLMVVRHEATGAAWRVASWVGVPVVNGGDGAHQHPTQGLLDALTLRHRFGKLDGLQMAVVGDIRTFAGGSVADHRLHHARRPGHPGGASHAAPARHDRVAGRDIRVARRSDR